MSVAENPMTFFTIFQFSQPNSAQRPQATQPAQQGNTASLPAVATASAIWGPGVAVLLRRVLFFVTYFSFFVHVSSFGRFRR